MTDITTISKAALERNGFEVQTFGSSLSALENFKPGSYDLLVVDIKMRDMNGFELYDEIRKIDNDIEVCFLTAATEYYDKYKQRYSSKKKEFFYNETCFPQGSSKYNKFNFKLADIFCFYQIILF